MEVIWIVKNSNNWIHLTMKSTIIVPLYYYYINKRKKFDHEVKQFFFPKRLQNDVCLTDTFLFATIWLMVIHIITILLC
jgi:hypothetical protein